MRNKRAGVQRRGALKKIGRGFAVGIALLALSAALWLFYERFVRKEPLPALFGYAAVTVLSGSMEPAFSAGDLLVIRQQDRYEPGDIVTFSDGGVLITHRIIGREEDGFRTKGDANNAADGALLRPQQIRGRVVCRLPAAGRVVLFLRTPAGLLLVLTAGLGALILTGPRQKRQRKGGEREK